MSELATLYPAVIVLVGATAAGSSVSAAAEQTFLPIIAQRTSRTKVRSRDRGAATMTSGSAGRRAAGTAAAFVGRLTAAGTRSLEHTLGGAERLRVVVLLASVLALGSADASTVGASATQLRHGLHISNTDIGLLVSVSSIVAAAASLPFGVLADRVRRTWTLAAAIVLWGGAMIWSAAVSSFGELLLARLALGGVTAIAGPFIASLVGDYFRASERGRIYGFILAGELVGAGVGFAVTGDIAALSWRAAFVILALPAFVLAWLIARLPEPARGGSEPLIPVGHVPDTDESRESHDSTAAQQLARERRIEPHEDLVLTQDPRRLGLVAAVRYILRVRTNVVLIVASAFGYYFLAGVQTFGVEFTTGQYGIDQALANVLLLVVGVGAIAGVLAGGAVGDLLLRHGYLNGRILVSAIAAAAAAVLFLPAILTHSARGAVLYLVFAAFAISAQNPPLDAARLDIMPPLLWGRAEGVRTFLRTAAQALAPLLFGAVSDYVFGGGRSGLQWTFAIMLLPLTASAYYLFAGLRTYPRDVATAAATAARAAGRAASAEGRAR
ncbi:MAG: MFS transporter [Gaiellaceae bacterium]